MRARFARLPLRIRLTLVFTGVMALVLAAGGFAIYTLFEADLDRTLEDGLRARAGDAGALLRANGVDAVGGSGESYAQVLGPEGPRPGHDPARGKRSAADTRRSSPRH